MTEISQAARDAAAAYFAERATGVFSGSKDPWMDLLLTHFARFEAEIVERCAKVAHCQFDDRPRLPANIDWQDGYEQACRDAPAAIRSKP